MSKESAAKNKPLFSLSDNMIIRIASNTRITASEICALLTVACHTDETGIYSTAGAKAVRNALGIGQLKAEGLLNKLDRWGYIRSVSSLRPSRLKDEMPVREGRAMVRWIIIEPDNSRRIWMSTSLVQGHGRWIKPLSDLRGCGNLAARLLMALYLGEDPITYAGISPLFVFRKYSTEFVQEVPNCHYDLHHAAVDTRSVFNDLHYDLLRVADDSIDNFWQAFKQLDVRGFIYECLTIFAGTGINEDMCMLYPLHTYNRHGHAPQGEESIASQMHKIASAYDYPLTDSSGRFYGRFAFIADTGMQVQAVGVYRLRFRNTSPAFEEVSQGWKHLQECKRRWESEVDHILSLSRKPA